jgi:threonine/homoserine/homoserine lactone efflux protein
MFQYVLAASIIIATPGADVLLAIATSLSTNVRAGLAAVVGMSTAYIIHSVLAGLGLAALLSTSKNALLVVEIAGASYLLGAGASQLRHRNDPPQPVTALITPLRRGFMTSLLNPKGTIFFLAFLPRYLPTHGPRGLAAFGLGLIFAAMTVVIYGTYALAAGACRAMLNGERVTVRLRTVAGGVFVFFGVSLCVELIR